MNNDVSAVIVAAGSGVRFGAPDKVFAPLSGRPMVAWSLDALSAVESIQEIVIVAASHTLAMAGDLLSGGNWPKVSNIVLGGQRRQDSVSRGVASTSDTTHLLLIHDAARPLVAPHDIERCIQQAGSTGAAILGVPVADTLKRTNSEVVILETVPRESMWAAQTPQVFERSLFLDALARAESSGWVVTDDASMVEKAGGTVTVVPGNALNFKITSPADAQLAERVLMNGNAGTRSSIRTGLGYDVHRFAAGRPLILGGIEIPSDRGLDGHSDADVLLHAITDALLGSAALGDIGTHFPPSDERWRDASSLIFLKASHTLLQSVGGTIINIDATIIAEAPKVMPHAAAIRQSIAAALGLEVQAVNIKATTNESMGFVGRGEGMAALAIVTTVVYA